MPSRRATVDTKRSGPPASTSGGPVIGIYPRLSDDPDETALGIQRQEEDCRREAQRLGASKIKLYTETDTSAWKRRRVPTLDPVTGLPRTVLRVIRPVWSQMMMDLSAGSIDAVVVYDLDRLCRDPRDLEDIIDTVTATGRAVLSTNGALDLTTADGVAMARVVVAMANKASADTSRRVVRQKASAAMNGLPTAKGGHSRAFGYTADGMKIVKSEAAVYRRYAQAVVDGVMSVGDVVNELARKNVPTVKGGAWTWPTVFGMFSNPRYAGLRGVTRFGNRDEGQRASYYDILRDENGVEVQGVWPALIDRDVWDRLQIVIDAGPHRRSERNGKASQLLVGILRCSKCGAGLHSERVKRKTGPSFKYVCSPRTRGGCRGIRVDGPSADADITARFVATLLAGTAAVATTEVNNVDEELTRLTRLLDEGAIDATAWAIATTRVRAQARPEQVRRPIGRAAGKRLVAEFVGAPLLVKRRMIQDWAPAILVMPVDSTDPRTYRPERLRVAAESAAVTVVT